MSEKLLLTDKNRCPQCGVRRTPYSGICGNCGTRIFMGVNIDFQAYEDEGNVRHWWAWTPDRGFVHRDHFMVKTAKPQERYQKPIELEKDYGRSTTPGEVTARGGKLELNVKPE